jgi:hypothetical protein
VWRLLDKDEQKEMNKEGPPAVDENTRRTIEVRDVLTKGGYTAFHTKFAQTPDLLDGLVGLEPKSTGNKNADIAAAGEYRTKRLSWLKWLDNNSRSRHDGKPSRLEKAGLVMPWYPQGDDSVKARKQWAAPPIVDATSRELM